MRCSITYEIKLSCVCSPCTFPHYPYATLCLLHICKMWCSRSAPSPPPYSLPQPLAASLSSLLIAVLTCLIKISAWTRSQRSMKNAKSRRLPDKLGRAAFGHCCCCRYCCCHCCCCRTECVPLWQLQPTGEHVPKLNASSFHATSSLKKNWKKNWKKILLRKYS